MAKSEYDNDNSRMYRVKPVIFPKVQKYVDLNYYVVVNASGQTLSGEFQKPDIYAIRATLRENAPVNERSKINFVKVKSELK